MPFCVRCGSTTLDSDQFCARCGASTGTSTPPAKFVDPRVATRSDRTRFRIALIIGVVVLVVAAVALVFDLSYGRRDEIVTERLPVHVLPTEVVAASPTYPLTVTVRLPRRWVHALGAYGVAGAVLLAPAGWRDAKALIGQDGSRRASLQATNGSAILGQVNCESEQGTDVGYVWQTAAEYFPWLRGEWSSAYGNSASPPAPLPGLVERPEGTQLTRYSLRSGAEVNSGLQVNGVARTTLKPDNLSNPGFDRLEVALPPQDQALATIIINYYIVHDK